MKSPHEFYLETNGKVIDIDGAYGGQCWDLFALFCQEYCNYIFGCPFTGYVEDLWYHFEELHLDYYFEKIPFEKYHELQDGDWLIWVKRTNPLCWISDSSHIAMFRKYNDGNPEQNIILTQNPGCTHQQVADFLGFVGALRPKCYIHEEIIKPAVELDKSLPNPVKEDKDVPQLKVTCNDTMRVRKSDSLDAEILGFAKEGFYNILNIVISSDYTWFEVEKDKWIALYPPYTEYIPVNYIEEKIDEQEEIELINKDKENPLIEFIKWLIKLLEKLIRGTYEK